MSNLIYPGDPEFDFILGISRPPDWEEFAFSNPDFTFVADSATGILRPATTAQTDEYLLGGEFEERLAAIGDDCHY